MFLVTIFLRILFVSEQEQQTISHLSFNHVQNFFLSQKCILPFWQNSINLQLILENAKKTFLPPSNNQF